MKTLHGLAGKIRKLLHLLWLACHLKTMARIFRALPSTIRALSLLEQPQMLERIIKHQTKIKSFLPVLDAGHSLRIDARPLKIIIGAGGTNYPDWVAAEQQSIDLLDEGTWRELFQNQPIDNILAEHVWEHLPETAGAVAARTCFRHLRPGGKLRIAVPDGYNPNPQYIRMVRPGGTGIGSDDHHVLYNFQTLSRMLNAAGFIVTLLEYHDARGQFHVTPWEATDGFIERSARFDPRNTVDHLKYTSLIVDAVKPITEPS